MRNQKGFTTVEAILIAILLLILGGVGYYVWQANSSDSNYQTTSQPAGESASKDDAEPEQWKTFTKKDGYFTLEYPESWKTATVSESTDSYGTFTLEYSLTSPTGTVLTVQSENGGKGGYCDPASGDKPYAKGNQCPTHETLSKEKVNVGIANNNYTQYLVTEKYASANGDKKYIVGLTDESIGQTIKLNMPEMGLFAPVSFFAVDKANGEFLANIYAYSTGDSKSFLQSDDAETVKEILKTLKVTNLP